MSLYIVLFCCLFVQALSLTVHLIPHSHQDVAWLKTTDQYFSGLNQSFYRASVTNIFTSITASLLHNPGRTFVLSEQAYLHKWWQQQDQTTRQSFKQLVSNRQIEFVCGGWSQHDEATTHIIDLLDQMTLGHRFIDREFGASARPVIGWQIDTLGHSSIQANVMGPQLGFEALFIGRVGHDDLRDRIANKSMQFVWQPSQNFPNDSMWTEIVGVDGDYRSPAGLCWDYLCPTSNQPIQDDVRLDGYNVQQHVDDFVAQALTLAATRPGDPSSMNVAMLMGGDFHGQNSAINFINMDKLIKAVNQDGRVAVKYSTPSVYYAAKQDEKLTWTVYQSDFFPLINQTTSQSTGHNSRTHQNQTTTIATGYYSSRPGIKGMVRSSSQTLQTIRQVESLVAITSAPSSANQSTNSLWEQLSLAQHHNTITGTQLQHVAYDTVKQLAAALNESYQVFEQGLNQLTAITLPIVSCPLLNQSVCLPMNQSFVRVIYWSPSMKAVNTTMYLPMYSRSNKVVVRDASNGKVVESSVTDDPMSDIARLGFVADLPALGFVVYDITQSSEDLTDISSSNSALPSRRHHRRSLKQFFRSHTSHHTTQSTESPLSIENKYVRLSVDSESNLIESWLDKQPKIEHSFSQQFFYYQSSVDESVGTSNAYNFMPSPQHRPTAMNHAVSLGKPAVKLIDGSPIFVSLIQTWPDWMIQEVRLELTSNGPHVDFFWKIGPIPHQHNSSKEIITRYSSDISSGDVIYTDANGMELREQTIHSLNKSALTPPEVASNYYPVTSLIGVIDGSKRAAPNAMFVLTDRAEGGTSLKSGEIELMLNRRLLCPCGFLENLNETDSISQTNGGAVERCGKGLIVSGHHRVVLAAREEAFDHARPQQHALLHQALPAFTTDRSTIRKRSFLANELPEAVSMHTMQVLEDRSILFRFAHRFAANESTRFSLSQTFDLAQVFLRSIATIEEVSLSTNRRLSVMSEPYLITLDVMQIRAFIVTFVS